LATQTRGERGETANMRKIAGRTPEISSRSRGNGKKGKCIQLAKGEGGGKVCNRQADKQVTPKIPGEREIAAEDRSARSSDSITLARERNGRA